MGTMGFGVWIVSGRSRVPFPPARRMAFLTNSNSTVECRRPPGLNPMNLPNTLTLVRMFLVPLLVVVLLTEFEGQRIVGVPKELVGAAIFGLASLTDWLDG